MVSVADVEDALYEELAQSRGCSTASVHADVGAGGEIDSLEGVELVAAAEGKFGVRISDRELTSKVCSSIPRLAQLVAAKTETATRKGT
jgi:acyl carrier protein